MRDIVKYFSAVTICLPFEKKLEDFKRDSNPVLFEQYLIQKEVHSNIVF